MKECKPAAAAALRLIKIEKINVKNAYPFYGRLWQMFFYFVLILYAGGSKGFYCFVHF